MAREKLVEVPRSHENLLTDEALANDVLTNDTNTFASYTHVVSVYLTLISVAIRTVDEIYQFNPLMLIAGDPARPGLSCPVCYLNCLSKEHDKECDHPNCQHDVNYDTSLFEKAIKNYKMLLADGPDLEDVDSGVQLPPNSRN